jgi:membrane protease YdiL (CAAX protease family)
MRRPPVAVLLFVAVVFALSLALSLIVGLSGGEESPIIGLGFLSMLFPAIAMLIVQAATGERVSIDWGRLPLRFVPVALILVPAVLHAAMLPVASTLERGLRWQQRWSVLTVGELVGRVALNAAVGLAVVSALALFEEIGWRAWLLPRLASLFGTRRALVGAALIAAAWHLPYVASGIHHIAGMSPAATGLIMSVGQVGSALVFGWLWIRTESIWIVALAHGALNNWGQFAFKYLEDFRAADERLVLGAGNLALLLLGTVLLLDKTLTSSAAPTPGWIRPHVPIPGTTDHE